MAFFDNFSKKVQDVAFVAAEKSVQYVKHQLPNSRNRKASSHGQLSML